jgi:phage terminase small subunit
MPKGPKPKPIEIKKARGTDQPCRVPETVVEFPAVVEHPKPPRWMNRDGKSTWNELVPMLLAARVLTDADLFALRHLCQLDGELVSLYRKKMPVTASMLTQLKAYFENFGITPSSRARVTRSEKIKENPFKRQGKPEPKKGTVNENTGGR